MQTLSPIIITGASQRIGLAVALSLFQQGLPVVISYRTQRPLISELQDMGIICIRADFSSENGVTEFIEEIKKRYDSLRAVIHNASEWFAESDTCSPEVLMERMWHLHVMAPYRINLSFESLLYAGSKHDRPSDIIHITDFVAEKGSDKHLAYASSKAGLANLTLSFAKRCAPRVKVNSIAPSLLMFHDSDTMEYRKKALSKSLLAVEPGEREGVEAVQYLLNSRYITGRTLSLDGGRHLA